jgi:hypothetical protein
MSTRQQGRTIVERVASANIPPLPTSTNHTTYLGKAKRIKVGRPGLTHEHGLYRVSAGIPLAEIVQARGDTALTSSSGAKGRSRSDQGSKDKGLHDSTGQLPKMIARDGKDRGRGLGYYGCEVRLLVATS